MVCWHVVGTSHRLWHHRLKGVVSYNFLHFCVYNMQNQHSERLGQRTLSVSSSKLVATVCLGAGLAVLIAGARMAVMSFGADLAVVIFGAALVVLNLLYRAGCSWCRTGCRDC